MASVVPRAPHDSRAPSVVVNEAIIGLRELGHDVVFQLLLDETQRPLTAFEDEQMSRVAGLGVEVLAPLWRDSVPRTKARFVNPMVRYYPSVRFAREIGERVRATGCTHTFSLWCHLAVAAGAFTSGVRKAIYYGNLDNKQIEARLDRPDLFAATRKERLLGPLVRLQAMFRLRLQMRLLGRYDRVWSVCATDVDTMQRYGIHQARYIQNMWPEPPDADVMATRRRLERLAPAKICASIGGLQGTANTHGLYFLGTELAPAVDRAGLDVELNVYGARQPAPPVARALVHPRIHIRGFIDDIDRELLESPVFLVCNNYDRFRAGHTRFLHAWSLGACVIAHRGNRDVMPELVHGRNVLLAETAEEFVRYIREACGNEELRRRIGLGGMETHKELFIPRVVVQKIATGLTSLSAPSRSAIRSNRHSRRSTMKQDVLT